MLLNFKSSEAKPEVKRNLNKFRHLVLDWNTEAQAKLKTLNNIVSETVKIIFQNLKVFANHGENEVEAVEMSGETFFENGEDASTEVKRFDKYEGSEQEVSCLVVSTTWEKGLGTSDYTGNQMVEADPTKREVVVDSNERSEVDGLESEPKLVQNELKSKDSTDLLRYLDKLWWEIMGNL